MMGGADTLLESVIQRWRLLQPRERRLVLVAVIVLSAAGLFLFAFEPAWNGRETLERRLPELRGQVAVVDRIVREARELESAPRAPVQTAQAVRLAIENSIDSAGLRSPLVRLQVNGALIDLEFRQASFSALIGWLDATLREQRLRVLDVSLTRESAGDRVSGRVLLEHAHRAPAAQGAR
jgi:type II secretory pathway component PulM